MQPSARWWEKDAGSKASSTGWTQIPATQCIYTNVIYIIYIWSAGPGGTWRQSELQCLYSGCHLQVRQETIRTPERHQGNWSCPLKKVQGDEKRMQASRLPVQVEHRYQQPSASTHMWYSQKDLGVHRDNHLNFNLYILDAISKSDKRRLELQKDIKAIEAVHWGTTWMISGLHHLSETDWGDCTCPPWSTRSTMDRRFDPCIQVPSQPIRVMHRHATHVAPYSFERLLPVLVMAAILQPETGQAMELLPNSDFTSSTFDWFKNRLDKTWWQLGSIPVRL